MHQLYKRPNDTINSNLHSVKFNAWSHKWTLIQDDNIRATLMTSIYSV